MTDRLKISELSADEFSTLKRLGILDRLFPSTVGVCTDDLLAEAKIIMKKATVCSDVHGLPELQRLAKKWLKTYNEI